VLTLDELLIGKTADEILERELSLVQDKGLPITDYFSGAAGRTMLEVNASVTEDVYESVKRIAKWGTLSESEDDWLDARIYDEYLLERNPATFAVHQCVLTCTTGFGPYTISPNSLWSTTPGQPEDAKAFSVLTGGTLNDGGTLTIEVIAERSGSAYNVAPNSITILRTPLPGVSINNPAMPVINTSLLMTAQDRENDEEYIRRARLSRAVIGAGRTDELYEYWARTARSEVKQVKVYSEHPRGQGTVDIVIHGDDVLTSGIVADVNAYIQLRKPGHADVLVSAATVILEPVIAALTVKAGYQPQANAAVLENLLKLARAVGIGGISDKNNIITALGKATAIQKVVLNIPTTDRILNRTQVVSYPLTTTWIEV
jgi:uncharacterized phage protein gp47/JayE